jgi:hypothetical protein
MTKCTRAIREPNGITLAALPIVVVEKQGRLVNNIGIIMIVIIRLPGPAGPPTTK